MKYKFLCQDCLAVVESDNWDKYHNTLGSCPICKSGHADMCGCEDCLQLIEEQNLVVFLID